MLNFFSALGEYEIVIRCEKEKKEERYGAADTSSSWRHEVKGPAGCLRHAVYD